MSVTDIPKIPSGLKDLYDVLSATRRCYAIQILAISEEDPLDASVLAKRIMAIEQDIEPTKATGEQYRSVYMTLCQDHLPTLDDSGVINFDEDRKTVSIDRMFNNALLVLSLNYTTFTHLETDTPFHSPHITSIGD